MVFVEYRKEDPAVRIKEVHKMSVRQLEKEMNAVGLVRVRTVEILPLQHIVIFERRDYARNPHDTPKDTFLPWHRDTHGAETISVYSC